MSDSLMSVDIASTGNTYVWAKWSLLADAPLPESYLFWMKKEGRKWKLLVTDDAELATLKAALEKEGIRYGAEENIEPTPAERQYIESAQIADRSEVEAVLTRAARVENITTVEGLKEEVLRVRPSIGAVR